MASNALLFFVRCLVLCTWPNIGLVAVVDSQTHYCPGARSNIGMIAVWDIDNRGSPGFGRDGWFVWLATASNSLCFCFCFLLSITVLFFSECADIIHFSRCILFLHLSLSDTLMCCLLLPCICTNPRTFRPAGQLARKSKKIGGAKTGATRTNPRRIVMAQDGLQRG